MIYEQTVPQMIRMLQNLLPMLEKGAAYADHKKFDIGVLLHSRLAPDQFDFTKQIQLVSDTAKFGTARLAAQEAPAWEDNEKSLGDIKARIEKTISYLKKFSVNDFQGAEDRKITTPRWEGKYLTGKEYTQLHLLPNFYFHITTAYSILRHNGVDVGKKDYLGEIPYRK